MRAPHPGRNPAIVVVVGFLAGVAVSVSTPCNAARRCRGHELYAWSHGATAWHWPILWPILSRLRAGEAVRPALSLITTASAGNA